MRGRWLLSAVGAFVVVYVHLFFLQPQRMPIGLEPEPEIAAYVAKPRQPPKPSVPLVMPVLILTHSRGEYLRQTLLSIISKRPSVEMFPIIVSQDGDLPEVTDVIRSFPVQHIKVDTRNQGGANAGHYNYISRHYSFALRHVFGTLAHQAAIILEDDIEVAEDFFEYFLATYNLLARDNTLWCVSAFNDNGQYRLVWDPERLYRTSFFPGLGWMTTRRVWLELEKDWPDAFWDEWMRLPHVRKGRDCIRPEISRSKTFGEEGSSGGQYYRLYLRTIKLSKGFVPFQQLDLSYLAKDKYNLDLADAVGNAVEVSSKSDIYGVSGLDLKWYWSGEEQFMSIAREFHLMNELKNEIPRSSYDGVVVFSYLRNRIFLIDRDAASKRVKGFY